MAKAPKWPIEEFLVVLKSIGISNVELSKQLPLRTINAIQFVKLGIHDFHIGKDYKFLSNKMKSYLIANREPLRCPVCGRYLNTT
ncbi:MAG: hypothetical protein ABSG90_02390 [Dehalococcoidia bacterium]